MMPIPVLKSLATGDADYPRIVVNTYPSPLDKQVTYANVSLLEIVTGPAISTIRIRLLKRRAKISHAAAIAFARQMATTLGLSKIYDTTLGGSA